VTPGSKDRVHDGKDGPIGMVMQISSSSHLRAKDGKDTLRISTPAIEMLSANH